MSLTPVPVATEAVPGTSLRVSVNPWPNPVRGFPPQFRIYDERGIVLGGAETKEAAVERAIKGGSGVILPPPPSR